MEDKELDDWIAQQEMLLLSLKALREETKDRQGEPKVKVVITCTGYKDAQGEIVTLTIDKHLFELMQLAVEEYTPQVRYAISKTRFLYLKRALRAIQEVASSSFAGYNNEVVEVAEW